MRRGKKTEQVNSEAVFFHLHLRQEIRHLKLLLNLPGRKPAVESAWQETCFNSRSQVDEIIYIRELWKGIFFLEVRESFRSHEILLISFLENFKCAFLSWYVQRGHIIIKLKYPYCLHPLSLTSLQRLKEGHSLIRSVTLAF